MALRIAYRRVIVQVHQPGLDDASLRLAAELARLLDLDLQGVFVEDEAMLALAGLPFARELRLPGHEWRTLDPHQILHELEAQALRARRLLETAAAGFGIATRFEIVRADPEAAVKMVCGTTDIVVVTLPRQAAERISGAFARAEEAAYRSPAAMLLIPSGVMPRHGPIAVAADAADDVSLATAARLALKAREDLLMILPETKGLADDAIAAAQAAGMPAEHVRTRPVPTLNPSSVARMLGTAHARLLVLRREVLTDGGLAALSRLAAERAVPLLVVEPAVTAPGVAA